MMLGIFSFTVSMTGCNHWLDDLGLRDEVVYPPAYPIDHEPPPKRQGTIYQAGYDMSLYQDHIAHRIGDILTVHLEESTQGQKQVATKTNKISTINTNNGNMTNNQTTNNGAIMQPQLVGVGVKQLIFNTGSEIDFDGKGQANQSNRLTGTISVTIMRVLSNGNMMIQGESWVTINQGREYIRLTGIVRSEDIEADNTISSQRITNARIAYSGTGQIGNATRGGLMWQLFNKFFIY